MTTRAVEKLIGRYVAALGLDPAVTVHSLRVTALTTARERGSDIIDLQDFAGHADPRTTLTYYPVKGPAQQKPRLRAEILTNKMNSTIQQRSPHDDISGLNPGLHVRTGHGNHVVARRADGVGDFGGEVVLHPVQDAIDRDC